MASLRRCGPADPWPQPEAAAEATVDDVVLDPPLGPVLVGTVVLVDLEDVVVEVELDLVDVLPGLIFGNVVVVVVVVDAVPGDSTCWACVICWAIAWMSVWKVARLPAFNAASALS